MKKIIIMALSLLFLVSFVNAQNIVSCINQDANSFCVPSDSSCIYSEADSDDDNDGWSNSCDAYPHNQNEWIDVDADGVGHNSDCDDFDPSVGLCLIQAQEDNPEDSETQVAEITNTLTNGVRRRGSSSSDSGSGNTEITNNDDSSDNDGSIEESVNTNQESNENADSTQTIQESSTPAVNSVTSASIQGNLNPGLFGLAGLVIAAIIATLFRFRRIVAV